MFSLSAGQHHCRACGRLYCYACSRFRALLPRSFGTRDPQRLCQPCNARVAPLQEMLAGTTFEGGGLGLGLGLHSVGSYNQSLYIARPSVDPTGLGLPQYAQYVCRYDTSTALVWVGVSSGGGVFCFKTRMYAFGTIYRSVPEYTWTARMKCCYSYKPYPYEYISGMVAFYKV